MANSVLHETDSNTSDLFKKFLHKDKAKKDIRKVTEAYKDLLVTTETLPGNASKYVSLNGTIPVTYKANVYNIPISILLRRDFPEATPLVYVRPTAIMVIKPNANVDASGQVAVPYLTNWSQRGSDLLALVKQLTEVFGREPPVFSRAAAAFDHQVALPYSISPSPAGLPYSLNPHVEPAEGVPTFGGAAYGSYASSPFSSAAAWPVSPSSSSAINAFSHMTISPKQSMTSPENPSAAVMPTSVMSPVHVASSPGSHHVVPAPAPAATTCSSPTSDSHVASQSSATDLALTIEQDLLTCPICLEKFSQPKCLPCMHTFCRACLHAYLSKSVQNGVVFCPTCRKRIPWGPSSSVDALQSNFLVTRLMDTMHQTTSH